MDTGWVKQSSSQGNCVAVQRNGHQVLITEDDRPGTVVVTTPENFAYFLEGAKRGTFDYLVADVDLATVS